MNGVTFPKGFLASGTACGIKKNGKADVALIVCQNKAVAAGIFTKNIVKGHSLQLAQENVANGEARAVIINAGNANACLAKRGEADAKTMAEYTAKLLDCSPNDIMTGSTGVIGVPMPMDKLKNGIKQSCESLSKDGGAKAARAIMTTDTHPKMAETTVIIHGTEVRIGAMAKGSGMIHPNMATMISIITTDAKIEKTALKKILKHVADKTYNRISVDGDTSVCDKVIILASGLADNKEIIEDTKEFLKFAEALLIVCTKIAKMLAADGEGATKLLTIVCKNAKTIDIARIITTAISKSPLCKTAAFGEDANWGRILTAAGYSGAIFEPEKVDIFIGDLQVCKNGGGLAFDEDRALNILKQKEVTYTIDIKQGDYDDTAWTCDLSYDYVKINGDYRT